MIGNALRYEIECHAVRARASNPLLRAAIAGRVTPPCIERYLSSLRYVVASSFPFLNRAAARARELGKEELARYFQRKAAEEHGHDAWADADLATLRSRFMGLGHDEPVPSIAALMEFCEETIDREPCLYLAYVFWAEYFVTLVGGELVAALVDNCGLPPSAMTCLSKHVELDQEHAADDFDVIDTFVTDPTMLPELRAVLHRTAMLFDRACEEMLEPMLTRAAS